MKRRGLLAQFSAIALAWSCAVPAQQPVKPIVGVLVTGSKHEFVLQEDALRQGLRELGFIDDRNVEIDYRYAEGAYDRLPGLAADLVRRKVAVIATLGASPSALAAKGATATIPIVFGGGADPLKLGIVTSLSRPIGNATGVVSFS